MPVGAVEHGICARRPGRIAGKTRPAAVDATPAHLTFRRFLLVHRRQSEVCDHRQYQDLQHWLAWPEDMRVSLDRRFEHDERDHRPPFCAQQSRHRDRNGIGWICVETWMWFGAYRPMFCYFQIEQQLVSVIILAEAAEWRPHQVTAILRTLPEVAVKYELAAFPADAKLLIMRIEHLDAVLRAFGEGCAMPSIFLRAVGARLWLAGPARHFELGPSRRELGIYQAVFDPLH